MNELSFSSIMGSTDFGARANFLYVLPTVHAVSIFWYLGICHCESIYNQPLKLTNSKNTMLSLILSKTYRRC